MNMFRAFIELDEIQESMNEGVYDFKPSNKSNWITSNGTQVKLNQQSATQAQATTTKPAITSPNGKCVVVIVSDKDRLRAFGTDGANPAAFVAFPNNLRQYEGQKYEVDQLIWNGKNYRVSGNIVEI
jgi:hypothetical protein